MNVNVALSKLLPAVLILFAITGVSAQTQQTRARHILIPISGIASENEVRNLLHNIKKRLDNKEDFAVLARAYSKDSSASKGGNLGWLSPGETVPEFERAMAALQVGQISEPVRSQYGWHLIQVLERRTQDQTPSNLTLEQRFQQLPVCQHTCNCPPNQDPQSCQNQCNEAYRACMGPRLNCVDSSIKRANICGGMPQGPERERCWIDYRDQNWACQINPPLTGSRWPNPPLTEQYTVLSPGPQPAPSGTTWSPPPTTKPYVSPPMQPYPQSSKKQDALPGACPGRFHLRSDGLYAVSGAGYKRPDGSCWHETWKVCPKGKGVRSTGRGFLDCEP